MVSIKRFIFVLSVLFVFCGTDCVYARNETVTTPIKECEGSSESYVGCERTLPDGTKQTGYGWCTCRGGMLGGGCPLAEYTYTDRILSTNGGSKCRTCTVPSVIRGCGGFGSVVVDESPSCGEWSSCGDSPAGEFCLSKSVQYRVNPGDDCGTQERKCCDNNTWSEWGKACPTAGFEGSESQKCSIFKPASCLVDNGTCQIGDCICVNGKWNCSKIITCNSGYVKSSDGNSCVSNEFTINPGIEFEKGCNWKSCKYDSECSFCNGKCHRITLDIEGVAFEGQCW